MHCVDMKIGMISVLYNPSVNMIRKSLDNSKGTDKLVIIDNSSYSNEELIASMNKLQIDYVYIPNYRNVGLAKALNHGMKIIGSFDLEWCLVLDQDSEVANDILNEYKQFILKHKTEKIGIIGPQYDYDNRRLRTLRGEKKRQWFMLSGSLINVSAFREGGGFDEGFFIDGLDVDFDFRLVKSGYNVVQCLPAVIHHCPGKRQSIHFLGLNIHYGVAEPFRYYHQARAGVYNGLMHSKTYGVYELGRKLVKIIFLFDEKGKYLRMFQRGVIDGIHWYLEKEV